MSGFRYNPAAKSSILQQAHGLAELGAAPRHHKLYLNALERALLNQGAAILYDADLIRLSGISRRAANNALLALHENGLIYWQNHHFFHEVLFAICSLGGGNYSLERWEIGND